jgi:hypothetical protein
MKKTCIGAMWILLSFSVAVCSGVTIFDDNFEGGTLTNWTEGIVGHWTNSTTTPISGTRSLKHNLSSVASNSYIYAQPSAYSLSTERTVWRFNLKNGAFDPTANNKFWVYLMSDSSDLTGTTANGYAVGVNLSGILDTVTLWRVTSGAVAGTVVGSSFDWNSSTLAGIEVDRATDGTWGLKIDTNGGFDNLVLTGTGTDTTHTTTTYLGLCFIFTSGNAGLLRMDDFSIVQEPLNLNLPEITITNPATVAVSVPNGTTTYDVQGTCNTSVIGQLSWTNSLTGAAGTVAAATSWSVAGLALNVGVNAITVRGTNNAGDSASDAVAITREALPPPAHTVAFINEVECDGAGADTNDFIELIAPAGTNLQGAFIIHYNGSGTGNGGIWRFDIPPFTVPDDGITDTNGVALGFCVIAQAGGFVANADFILPAVMEGGPDGIVLYDASSNILDAVAWEGYGDLATNDPGGLLTTGDPTVSNYLALIGTDLGTARTLQAPNRVLADNGTGWVQSNATAGAINATQVSGQIDLTGGGNPTAPEITITNPANYTIVDNSISTYDVFGTCNTNVIGEILWTNFLTGGVGSIPAATNWVITAMPLGIHVNTFVVTATNGFGVSVSATGSIQRETAETFTGSPRALLNEVECNGPGADTNDFIEIISTAGTNLAGCFVVHYNGAAGTDGGEWRFDLPSFVVPDDGIVDTNGAHLGFCVLAMSNSGLPNVDFELPDVLQAGPDGVVLYDANSNILDAVAWSGAGDLDIDDPGTVTITGFTGANNYLHVLPNDGAGTNTTLQAPNNVLYAVGNTWTLIPETPGAINGGQTSGYIVVTTEAAAPSGDSDGDGMPDSWEMEKFGTLTNGASGDNDNDTANNIEEYDSDTNPTNSDSVLRFIAFDHNAPSVSAMFKGGLQAVQLIEYTTNVLGGDWLLLLSNQPPTSVTNGFSYGANPAREFFRIRAYR